MGRDGGRGRRKKGSQKQTDIDTEITQFSLLTTLRGKVFKCHGRVCWFGNINNFTKHCAKYLPFKESNKLTFSLKFAFMQLLVTCNST